MWYFNKKWGRGIIMVKTVQFFKFYWNTKCFIQRNLSMVLDLIKISYFYLKWSKKYQTCHIAEQYAASQFNFYKLYILRYWKYPHMFQKIYITIISQYCCVKLFCVWQYHHEVQSQLPQWLWKSLLILVFHYVLLNIGFVNLVFLGFLVAS